VEKYIGDLEDGTEGVKWYGRGGLEKTQGILKLLFFSQYLKRLPIGLKKD
jgi:hypothetical protein